MSKKMSTKEAQEKLADTMRQWQKVENASIAGTAKVIEESDNTLLRLIMEIIMRDSQMHYRIQGLILDSLERQALSLSPEDLGRVWDKIEGHVKLEKRTVELAKEALEATADRKGLLLQRYLLSYLLRDEEKHNSVLAELEAVKNGIYPYA